MNHKAPKSRQSDLVVQEFNNEILIYDLKSDKAYCLNETSAMIWRLCDGKHSVEQISQNLSKKLNSPMTEDFIWLALDSFKKDSLLEESESFVIDFNGLTRRQVIKKVGFASMIVLPTIASVIAPSSAMAQSSGVLIGGACPPTCASGLQCRTVNVGDSGNRCCVPGIPSSQTITPGTPFCNSSCTNNPAVCCSGSQVPAPPAPFCAPFNLVTCICSPYS